MSTPRSPGSRRARASDAKSPGRSVSSRRGRHTSSPGPAPSSAVASSPVLSSSSRRQGMDVDEENLEEKLEQDYRAIPELDRYVGEGLDSQDYEAMAPAERREAEREMDARGRRGRRKRAGDLDLESEERPSKMVRVNLDEEPMQLDDHKGPLREWIRLARPRNEIKRKFGTFLSTWQDSRGRTVYPDRIKRMGSENKESLLVSYSDLSMAIPELAIWVADAPVEMLELFDEEATSFVRQIYPRYELVAPEIHVRITDLPIVDSLRDLRQAHLNVLIKVRGVVTRRTAVFPQLKVVWFKCVKCGQPVGPFTQKTQEEVHPGRCPGCQSMGPYSVNNEQTVYRNYQRITLQESPGTVPAGRVPRQKDVILLHDLIDCARPGEEVEITGVYTNNFDQGLNSRNGFPVFRTVIEANYVCKRQDKLESFQITAEDKEQVAAQSRDLQPLTVKQIMELAKKPNVAQIIFNSVAPSIYGHENTKIAMAMALFSGVPKKLKNKHRIRGDINVLVMGDPGTGKSQFLKYVEQTAHRAVYTTGKGASAVGLTASVRRDPLTREWTLEGGALVLADEGVCLIDEFDKMNDQDRTSIHEAMEQQSISISKAGIITTLQARCAIVAAANPVMGRYDSSLSFAENVNLTDAILSRFDILCVVRDVVDPMVDEQLAGFVVESHAKSHPNYSEAQAAEDAKRETARKAALGESISQDLLRKYILYAKQHCEPKLQQIDEHKISQLYSDLRRESMVTGGIPIAVRHIESIIRMSEAHAKMHLRPYVTDDDVNMAIRVMLESFFSTQKFAVMNTLRKQFRKYLTYNKDQHELLYAILQDQFREEATIRDLLEQKQEEPRIHRNDFEAAAGDKGIHAVSGFYKSERFKRGGFQVKGKMIVRSAAPPVPVS